MLISSEVGRSARVEEKTSEENQPGERRAIENSRRIISEVPVLFRVVFPQVLRETRSDRGSARKSLGEYTYSPLADEARNYRSRPARALTCITFHERFHLEVLKAIAPSRFTHKSDTNQRVYSIKKRIVKTCIMLLTIVE